MVTLLAEIAVPTLSQSQTKMLEAPISKEDIVEAMSYLNPSKAPGSDGLPLEFYTTYSETLVPKLYKLFSHIFITGSLPKSMSEAFIVLIPKPGKNLEFPES